MSGKSVQLGFAEVQKAWLLKNRFFPSKIGGFPAWLELENVPEMKELLCDYCNEPCIFLCQIYAGSENIPHAFHRTVFVFICRNGKCCSLNQSGNIKVFRSHLPLDNKFYPDQPADDSVECDEVKPPVNLCRVCACRGPLVCGKCKKVTYCGPQHQKIDWKAHKATCDPSKEATKLSYNDFLFPEFEIVIEQEEQQESSRESEQEAEKRRMREYEQMIKSGGAGAISEMSEADLSEFAESKEDKTFGKFKKVIEGYETQVIRYCRGASSPLWISDSGILSQAQLPNCATCNGRRTFEFQIMPQMLNELKNYDLDWGVIAIYTCEKDCDVKGNYVAEFVYKQDIIKGDEDEAEIDMEKLKLSSAKSKDNEISNLAPVTKPAKEIRNEASKNMQKSKQEKKTIPSKPQQKMFDECDNWE